MTFSRKGIALFKEYIMVTRRQVVGGLGAAAALGLLGGKALAPAPAKAAKPAAQAGYFPNLTLVTHEGKQVRFYDDLIKNKVVVINMMYAQCSEGVCPMTTMNMKRVHAALGDRVGRDIHMYSITLLPFFDTPEVLNRYVRDHEVQPGWQFLTGAEADIEVVRRKLGFYDLDPRVDADRSQHAGVVRIGNEPLDRWMMAPALGSVSSILQVIKHVSRSAAILH